MTNLVMNHDVVVISIAYRLGIYGFLMDQECEDAAECANFGILDQRAAMAWSQDFASFFGGDVNQVKLNLRVEKMKILTNS